MSSTKVLTRLAFRPLSSRFQCRSMADSSRPANTREVGGLVQDLMRSIESQRQRPSAFSRQSSQTGLNGQESDVDRPRGRYMDVIESRAVRPSARQREREELDAVERPFTKEDLERQMPRRWAIGDLYAPHDLTGIEAAKWKKVRPLQASKRDAFDQLGIDPMREYKNFSMMAEYVTETGRIKTRKETGLRPVNQRKIARAIRRAMGLGLMPRTYRHPELLKREMQKRRR